jgi:hypothetical protein
VPHPARTLGFRIEVTLDHSLMFYCHQPDLNVAILEASDLDDQS